MKRRDYMIIITNSLYGVSVSCTSTGHFNDNFDKSFFEHCGRGAEIKEIEKFIKKKKIKIKNFLKQVGFEAVKNNFYDSFNIDTGKWERLEEDI